MLPAISTPAIGLGASVRRSAFTCMPNASARSATAMPMPPSPTIATVLPPTESSGGFGKFQYFGGSCRNTSGKRLARARIAASTHSAIGTALAPRAQVTVRPV